MIRTTLFAITSTIVLGINSAQAQKLPNIVIVLADDMGYGDIQAYNHASKIPTPNLNSLAKLGMSFTDAHSPSAVCTPTRYGLLTGRYAWRTSLKSGVLWGYSPGLISKDRTTLASLLKEKGYSTAAVGKWHLGLGTQSETNYDAPFDHGPVDLGFDYFYGIPASLDMDPYVYVENDHVDVALNGKKIDASEMRREGGCGFWREGLIADGFEHGTVLEKLTEKAVAYISGQGRDKEKPFFLYFPLNAPHTPWMPPEEFRGKSNAGYYGDFAAQVDWTMGQITKSLGDVGAADNTLIIFTSDNGAHWLQSDIAQYQHLANDYWRGQKADIHEGGHRVPFIVKWPGKVAENSKSDHLMTLTDLMATFAALNERSLNENEGEDSYSILPVMLGEKITASARVDAIHHSLDGMFAIRAGEWKLIEKRGSGGFTEPVTYDPKDDEPRGQLYNLKADPAEKNNVYLDHPDVVAKLTILLNQYRDSGRSR